MEVALFARVIFGGGMAVHYLLSNMLPGMALGLVLLYSASFFRKDVKQQRFINLLTRLFAVQFAVAVVSGLTLQTDLYQNWNAQGNILGGLVNHSFGRSAIAGYVAITIMLLLLFALPNKINTALRWIIYLIIFISTILLSWWAVVVNSWMHTPAGTILSYAGNNIMQVSIVDLKQFIFNPSFLFRFLHVYTGAIIGGLLFQSVVVVIVLLKTKVRDAHYSLQISLAGVIFFLILQPVLGHLQFSVAAQYQPLKAAAFEGYYHSNKPPHYYLSGCTDPDHQKTTGIHLPAALEKRITASVNLFTSLGDADKAEWPNVKMAFYSFRIMLWCWAGTLLLIMVTLIQRKIHQQVTNWLLGSLLLALALSAAASVAGWLASEVGRQPWLVHGLIKTSSAHSYRANVWSDTLSIVCSFMIPVSLTAACLALQKTEWLRFKTTCNELV